ncbi:MAG TPA: putative Ig domain-containing protein [Opitutaceae bacterium]|nr:putative Ig domain-containing protein [Opitutaceae bacterium]
MIHAASYFRPKGTLINVLFLIGVAVSMGALQVDAAALQTVHGHRPAILSQLKPIGPLDKTQELNLAISLPVRNQAGLAQFLQQISDPKSPNYRHYLTPAQFTAQFGPTQSDYQAVIAFAKANGLTVTAQYANRLIVDVKGTVPVVEKALGVTMLSYQHPTEKRKFFAPNADPTLNLSVQVLGISGLDNYTLPQPRYKLRGATASQSGTTTGKSTAASAPYSGSPTASPNLGTGANGGYMGSDFRTAYVPGVALTGSGQTVGLLQFDGYTASDITYYETKANLPAVPLTNVLLDGFSGVPTGNGGEVEVSLDIEMSMSMAPGLAGIIVYEAGPSGNWHDILNRMANDNLAKQLSCSWYIPGGPMDPAADQIFQQMAAQGQSFFTASGDNDAFTGLIPFPGDTPYATEVGGTMLTTANAGGAYSSEQVWNRNDGIGTGGGISTQYAIPSWQQGISMTANLGSTTMRNVPDVALTAENAYVRADGSDQLVGGTSCAAPLWAGFTALVNQQAMVNAGTTVGFINPAVYAIGEGSGYATDFHDTTVGNNFSSSSPSKFPGTAGYDLCTGWGTPSGAALINALAPASIPVIADTNPLPSSSAGVAYNETLTATGGTPGYMFSILSGSLPNGLSLSSGGVISGTTNVSGTTADFTVQVTDSKGKSSSTALAITCLSAGTPVITTISPLPIGSTALAYNLPFAAAGGTPPYTYSPGTGTFPPGLTLSTGGILSGTPSATGTYTFDVKLTDNVGSNSDAPFTMTVGSPPTFTSGPTLASGILNSPYTQSIGATGGKAPYAWSMTSGALPAGLTMNGAGVITGTPTAAGTANFTVKVAGTDGLSSSQAFSLTIQAYGSLDHFIWGTIGSPQTVGTPFAVTITAQDSVNNTVTGFTGTATLASAGPQTILNSPTSTNSGNNGTWTLGYSFTPSSPITVTAVRSYSGSKVSIWTDSGVLLASTPVSGPNGVWTDTPITPVQLQSGVTYRVAFLSGGQTYYWSTGLPSIFANGTINQDYSASGDAFPTISDTNRWLFVDLKYTVGSSVPVSPGTTEAFTAGAWSGSLTISQAAAGVVLEASDGSGHIGNSNSFNVTTLANISVTPASGFTSTGGTGGPFTPGSASYQVTNTGSGSMSWNANGAPSWITLLPASGTLASGVSTTVTASINTAANSLGVGTYTGTINFNNTTSGFGNTSRSVSLTVTPPPPVITSSLTASASAGQPFSYQITASNSPTSFGATGLPTGLSINSTGLIGGTPAAGGISNITLSATNANGTGSATLVLTVQQAPTFTNAPLSVPIAIGSAYNFSFATTGTPTPTFAVTAGGLPPGLSLSSTGAITGAATQLGTYSGTVTATNSAGSASQNFTVTVVSGLVLGVTLPATVNEDDPDGQGTLSVSAVSSSPITVTLASSNTGALTVPATVTVPANQSSVPLPYTIIDNLSVYGTQTATVSASAVGWTGASQLVTVTDNKTIASWNTFGNGQAHTGVYRGSLLGVTYGQAWSATFSSGSTALNPVAVDKGLVYVTPRTHSGTADLTAVSAVTGTLVGSLSFASTGETSYAVNPPTVYKGNVYVQQGQGLSNGGSGTVPPAMWSINTSTGQTNWTAPFTAQWESYFAPTVYQSAGIWVDGGTYGGLYGFNFNGGQIAFVTEPQYDEWTPTYYNGVIYSYVAGSFQAVNPSTGAVSWSLSLTDSSTSYSMNCAMPIANNLAYANGHLYLNAVNVATHAVAWTVSGTFIGTPAVANGYVYVISGSQVEVLNGSTGASVTAYQTGDTGLTGQPIVASDSLVVSSSTSTYLFNLGTRALVQTIPYGGPVSVANGTLYLAGADGTLRAFHSAAPVAPTITSTNSAIFSTGQAGSFTVMAAGYPAATFSATGLPSWASLDSATGLLSGTPPTADGSPFTVTLTATNGVSPNANQTFSITVLQTYGPVITNGPPPAIATVGSNYAFIWTTTGYPFPTFAVTSGSLPPGLTLSGAGALTGTPTTSGTYSGTVTASNTSGLASQNFSITVNQAPAITSSPLSIPISQGSAFNFTFSATGSPAPTYSVSHGNLPPGLTLSSVGVISGMPTTPGTFTGTVTVTNTAGSASQNFSLTVVSGSILAFSLPSTVNESDPDGQGTVVISAVSGTTTTITLTSSNTGALTVPTSVIIPAGQNSVAFPYTIIDNLSVYGTQTTTVTATAAGWTTANQIVTVTDNKTTANWASFGNGQAHTGVYRGSLLGATYAEAWVVSFISGSLPLNQVAIENGVAYVTPISRFGPAALSAVNVTSGATLWNYIYSPSGLTSTGVAYNSINPPTYYKGNVYVQQGQGLSNGGSSTVPPALWSFNAATGQTNWTAPFTAQWESYLAPTVYQSIGIWVDGGSFGGLYGFNFNGSQSAFVAEPQYDEWTPTYYNGVVYSYVAGSFKAVDPSTGVVSWSLSLTDSSNSSMNCAVPIANNLAYANGRAYLNAVNVTTHAIAWTVSGTFTGTPAVANGNLYVISGSQVEVLNASTGASITAYQTGDTGLTGQPVVATDSLVVSSSTSTYLFNLQTGTLVQTIPYGGPVSVTNGTLYIAGSDGYLRAFRPGTSVAPTITSPNNTTFTVGQAGSFTVTATGFPVPTFSAAGLPSWASLNATTGVLSGTPLSVTGSPFTITVTAANGVNPNAMQNLTVTVNPTPYPPTIIGNPPPTVAMVGVPFNFTYTASGSPSPTFSVSSGALPAGLNLSSSGVLSGTPTTPGVYTGTVTAANGVGFPASQSFAITVQPVTSPPIITNGPPPSGMVGVFYSFSYTAVGVPTPTFSSGALPPGLTLTANGVLSGTPTTSGVYKGTIDATNGVSPDATQDFSITITPRLVPGWALRDFNGDGRPDILWHNTTTGDVAVWTMNGTTVTGATFIANIGPPWSIVGVGDFNGDDQPDILWRNGTTGEIGVTLMSGTTITSYVGLGALDPSWTVAGLGDFNGDGQTDVFLDNTTTGEVGFWALNGTTNTGYISIGNLPSPWTIAGVGDFNSDGKSDLLWYNPTTGDMIVSLMDGATATAFQPVGNLPLPWTVAGLADFNGDGSVDILLRNATTGDTGLFLMNGTTPTSFVPLSNVPAPWQPSD